MIVCYKDNWVWVSASLSICQVVESVSQIILYKVRTWEIYFGLYVPYAKRSFSSNLMHMFISSHSHFIKSVLAFIQNSRDINKIVYGTKWLLSL